MRNYSCLYFFIFWFPTIIFVPMVVYFFALQEIEELSELKEKEKERSNEESEEKVCRTLSLSLSLISIHLFVGMTAFL